MKRTLKKLMSALTAFAIAATLFASAAMAADASIYKSSASSNSRTYTTATISRNGFKLYNDGSSGYVQYNQTHKDTGSSPFGSPYVYAGGSPIIRSVMNVSTGRYYVILTGTGTGYAWVTGLPAQ